MGKAEKGTPKYIANKIKAKGLQKLRWYCQMCQKQCRDENGFKCHTMSESHQRQLLLVSENTEKFIDEFSKEFEESYLDLLRRQYGTRRVNANMVYQDYIHDRNHVHMNATEWLTLTDFIKYLGRGGKVVVDETEKGWFVTYIERDPETIALQERLQKKDKMEKDDNERMMEFLQQQVERGKSTAKSEEPQFTELQRSESEEQIKIQLKTSLPSTSKVSVASSNLFKVPSVKSEKGKEKGEKRKVSALDELMRETDEERAKAKRKDYWLCEGIVVKVVTKSLGDAYYKKKGHIIEVKDKYAAIVKMIENEHTLKLDQAHLETVIPAIGREVRILNGGYRGCTAILKELNEKKFSVTAEISSGPFKGRVTKDLPYEDISKTHPKDLNRAKVMRDLIGQRKGLEDPVRVDEHKIFFDKLAHKTKLIHI